MPSSEEYYRRIDTETSGAEVAPDKMAVSRAIEEVEADAPDADLRNRLGAEFAALQSEVEVAEGNAWFRKGLEDLTDEQLDHLAERARTSPNPYLRAQYADAVLFRRRGAKELVPVAVDAFLEHAARLPPTADRRITRSLSRAAAHVTRTRDGRLAERVAQGIRNAVQTLLDSEQAVAITDLVEPVIQVDRLHGEGLARSILEALVAAREHELRKTHLHFQRVRTFIEAAARLGKHLKEPDAVSKGQVELGELLVRWAETEDSPLGRQLRYKEAVEIFTTAGMSQRAKDILVRLESNKPSLEESLESFEQEIRIPRTVYERAATRFLAAGSLHDALVCLAGGNDLLPQVPQPGAISQGGILDVLEVVTLDAGFNMANVETKAERDAFRSGQEYLRLLAIHADLITYTLQRLRDEKDLSSEAVLAFLQEWELLNPSRLPFLESAVNAYFRGDTIGFIRTVLPEFEGLLRHVARVAGLPVMKRARSGDQEYRGIGDLIDLEPIRDVLGEHLYQNLRMVLVAGEGVAIRDNDAHAIAGADQYSTGLADVLLLLLLRLTRIAVDTESSSDRGDLASDGRAVDEPDGLRSDLAES